MNLENIVPVDHTQTLRANYVQMGSIALIMILLSARNVRRDAWPHRIGKCRITETVGLAYEDVPKRTAQLRITIMTRHGMTTGLALVKHVTEPGTSICHGIQIATIDAAITNPRRVPCVP